MLLTICTVRQLPQALVLGESFRQFAGQATTGPVLVGLVDSPDGLPPGFSFPYPLLLARDILPAESLTALSAQYTPAEFAAACKPLFIAEAFRRYPQADSLVYADPNIQFLAPLTDLWHQLTTANILLTPFITSRLSGGSPDEKFFQNIGLYNADFMVFRRSGETGRMLRWWDDRIRERAYINYCAGLCLDQIWLMHVPVFFPQTRIIRNPGWHVGLWNLPERTLKAEDGHWLVDGPAGDHQPLLFINFKGLLNADEGFFPHQNRLRFSGKDPVGTLLTAYRRAIDSHNIGVAEWPGTPLGQQPEPPVVRGWRRTLTHSMRAVTRFLDRVYLPAIR